MNPKHPPYNIALKVSGQIFVGLIFLVLLRIIAEVIIHFAGLATGVPLGDSLRSQLQDWFESLLKVGVCMGLSTLLLGSIWSAL